ncbi:MAG: ATP-binding protein [Phaeodactylibacter sp.]|nr:ATP-binding protein [Phaeodactylibacter sp.]MCB9053320.1 ATP-binding protein [Lewinellaceae bacterium]
MLLEFSVENFRSFRDRQVLSLLPDEGKKEEARHFFTIAGKYRVLRAAIVYGANASGKSNLMKAMQALRNLVLSSADRAPDKPFEEYAPFLFNARTASAPVSFETDFLLEEVRYHYRVSILKEEVVEEQLLFYPEGRESRLFKRIRQEFEFGDYLKGQKVVVSKLTGANQLFLSKAARNNIQQLVEVYRFFSEQYMPIPFLDSWVDKYYLRRIAKELESGKKNERFIKNFKSLLKSFDTGVVDFKVEEPELPFIEEDYEISVEHQVYDDDGRQLGTTYYPLAEESTGTQKLFVLGGLILRALMNGRVIIIDEFERSLHPLICNYLIQLFHNPEINTRGAQLILATHDTNLLSSIDFRRDQAWIVEKDQAGASEIFSLADITGILKDAPYEKWYLSGRLGGIPGIQRLDFELNYTPADEKK